MRLLVDQNISFRIIKHLRGDYPGSAHISSIGLVDASDRMIWSLAKKEGFIILTFDQDFIELAALRGTPPKIILLRSGNMGTLTIAHTLKKYRARIEEFTLAQDLIGAAVLELP